MKAIVYKKYGNPVELRLTEVPEPIPKANQILVKVHASSINSWDWDLLTGKHLLVRMIGGAFSPRHRILGADIAGTVKAVGKDVKDFKPGDEVFGDIANSGFGGFAEYVLAPEKLLAMKSPMMSFKEAASLPQAGLLAIQGLLKHGPLKPGQKILINGAGGGVGPLALQYAKSCGAMVTCVDKASKFDMLKLFGADHMIDYTTHDYTKNGIQYDLILDVIAHRTVSDYKRALKPGGAFVMIGGSMGGLLIQMMLFSRLISGKKKLGIMGYRPNRKDLDFISRLFEEKKMVPVIDRVYPLEEAPDAFRYFQTGEMKGKIVIGICEV